MMTTRVTGLGFGFPRPDCQTGQLKIIIIKIILKIIIIIKMVKMRTITMDILTIVVNC